MKDSGIPWIGMIPSDWEVEPIGRNIHEVDNPNVGGKETNALQFKAGTIISKSVGDSKYHPTTLEAYNVVDAGVIMLNGLNLSFDLISQRVGLVQEKGVITSAYLAIKPNEQIKSEFLTYLFKAYDARKALHAMGKGLRQTLAWKELKSYSVVYPPLPTQQRIADFLDRKCAEIDELAALQETMIAELKRYKQSVITEAVTKGLDPNVPMKDSGVEWIGEIPEGWEVKKVKNVTTAINKGNGITKEEVFADGDTPCVRYGEIYSKYDNSFVTCISKTKKDVLSALHYFGNGDILCAGTGELVEEIGKSIVYLGENKCLAGGDIIVLSHNQNPLFLNFALNSRYAQAQKSCSKAKLKVVHISAYDIGSVLIAFPPLTEQRAIADYLDKKCAEIDELIAIKQQKIEALKEYKKSVIFEYVTGKKEVL